MVPVTVSNRTKSVIKRNETSGHKWQEDTPTNIWEVRDQLGLHSFHRSKEAAEIEAKSHREFLEKYPY